MRKLLLILLATVFFSCKDEVPHSDHDQARTVVQDTVSFVPPPPTEAHSNARFRNVRAERIAEHRYRVSGEGQIFEASFGWVVEDGHNELVQGFATADAGAPSWGRFSFELDVEKERPESTLMLILFETSAEDGRRVHELPIALP